MSSSTASGQMPFSIPAPTNRPRFEAQGLSDLFLGHTALNRTNNHAMLLHGHEPIDALAPKQPRVQRAEQKFR